MRVHAMSANAGRPSSRARPALELEQAPRRGVLGVEDRLAARFAPSRVKTSSSTCTRSEPHERRRDLGRRAAPRPRSPRARTRCRSRRGGCAPSRPLRPRPACTRRSRPLRAGASAPSGSSATMIAREGRAAVTSSTTGRVPVGDLARPRRDDQVHQRTRATSGARPARRPRARAAPARAARGWRSSAGPGGTLSGGASSPPRVTPVPFTASSSAARRARADRRPARAPTSPPRRAAAACSPRAPTRRTRGPCTPTAPRPRRAA